MPNADAKTVAGFGDEWTRFNHANPDANLLKAQFERYFSIFPWAELKANPVGADFGCGSGRWSRFVLDRLANAGTLHLVDASEQALAAARQNLGDRPAVQLHRCSIEDAPIADSSLDYAFSLGVLHHVPDTARAVADIARKLKPGAPFLVYLYYRFDNRPAWYQAAWRASDVIRGCVSRLPTRARYAASQSLAASVYWPLARSAAALERIGKLPASWPLAAYRREPFYVMRTDALDRFGTRLEKRFTRPEIRALLEEAGFRDVEFSAGEPYWCALARKR